MLLPWTRKDGFWLRLQPQGLRDRLFARPQFVSKVCLRTSSSRRWQAKKAKDHFALRAKVQGLKSRAAFKLLEINERYKLFRRGQTVVDLGYAPGSWSQVAVDRTQPSGRVIGIDIIPAQPPKGVSTIQGNFLSRPVRDQVKKFLSDTGRARLVREAAVREDPFSTLSGEGRYIENSLRIFNGETETPKAAAALDSMEQFGPRVVDVVLSDMSEPWAQTDGFWKRSLSNPYYRMINTTGVNDHAGSMDLCNAALGFSLEVLRTGGHFVCKFYQGAEDKSLEFRLKASFAKVHREKPRSSRSDSKEAYFVALRKKSEPLLEEQSARDLEGGDTNLKDLHATHKDYGILRETE